MKKEGAQDNTLNRFSIQKTFLQIVQVKISNEKDFIHATALLSTVSNVTYLKREIATKLGLEGNTKCLSVTSVLLKLQKLSQNYTAHFQIT